MKTPTTSRATLALTDEKAAFFNGPASAKVGAIHALSME
jgi:hypothetical protein